MKYALVKFRIHLLGSKPFVFYTDHASLRSATRSPHFYQRMDRCLSLFAESNFEMKYRPGKQIMLSVALSLRPDYELAHVTTLSSPIEKLIRVAYPRKVLSVQHRFMLLGVRNTRTRTDNYRYTCGPAYIDIPSIMVSWAMAQMQWIPLALLYLAMRI